MILEYNFSNVTISFFSHSKSVILKSYKPIIEPYLEIVLYFLDSSW